MSEDFGIDYPIGLKIKANSVYRYDELTGERKFTPVTDFIRLTDKEQNHAGRLLTWFETNQEMLKQAKEEGNYRGWSLIRELRQEHQQFDVVHEPIAPDSIVVKNVYDSSNVFTGSYLYYVSARKDPDGMPLVYVLDKHREGKKTQKSDLLQKPHF